MAEVDFQPDSEIDFQPAGHQDAPSIADALQRVAPFARSVAEGNLRFAEHPVATLQDAAQFERSRFGASMPYYPTFQSVAPALGDVVRQPLEALHLPTGALSGFAPGTPAGAVARDVERKMQDTMLAGAADEAAYGLAGGLARTAVPGLASAARMMGPQPLDEIIDETIHRAIRPRSTAQSSAQYASEVARNREAVKTIHQFKSTIQLPDEAGQPVNRLPKSLSETGEAIGQVKRRIFTDYNALKAAAGDKGAVLTTDAVASALDEVAKNKVLQVKDPDIVQYASEQAHRFRAAKSLSPDQAQDMIASYNADLQNFYARPEYGKSSRAVVDAAIANNLREGLDHLIEGETGGQYGLLKRKYGQLKGLERDVTRRNVILSRKTSRGMTDLSHVLSGGNMVHGILSLNPALFAKGAAQEWITSWLQRLRHPDRMIQRMFGELERRAP